MVIWDDAVRSAAAHWGSAYGVTVDPALIHGIIERESRHGQDPRYLLYHGVVPEPGGHVSYGPMQVYDDTVDTLVGGSGLTGEDFASHPELGIWWGTKYFAKLLHDFGGDTARAVAGYNAGPGRANRDAAGNFPNQSYVDAVLSFWQRYKVAVASILPVLVIAGLVVVWLMRRGRA